MSKTQCCLVAGDNNEYHNSYWVSINKSLFFITLLQNERINSCYLMLISLHYDGLQQNECYLKFNLSLGGSDIVLLTTAMVLYHLSIQWQSCYYSWQNVIQWVYMNYWIGKTPLCIWLCQKVFSQVYVYVWWRCQKESTEVTVNSLH